MGVFGGGSTVASSSRSKVKLIESIKKVGVVCNIIIVNGQLA